jgi:peptidoglycan/LPS O-acetylase OafA/YrhL
MKTATTLVVLSTTIHLLAYLLPQAMPEHLVDMNWPEHARFHMWQATFWLIALDLMILLVALFPFRMKQPWSPWALVVGLLGAQVGYYIASVLVPDGRPDTQGADAGLLVVMAIYVAGLVLGWIQLRKEP